MIRRAINAEESYLSAMFWYTYSYIIYGEELYSFFGLVSYLATFVKIIDSELYTKLLGVHNVCSLIRYKTLNLLNH